MFDILLKPAPDLTDAERTRIKRVARELLEEDALDLGLPRADTPELFQQKYAAIFAYIIVSYHERDKSI